MIKNHYYEFFYRKNFIWNDLWENMLGKERMYEEN